MNNAHLHLLLNHLPVLGSVLGLFLLIFSLWRKSIEIKRVSLVVFVLTAMSLVPTYLTGEPAEEMVEHLPGVSEALVGQHESAALVALSAALATGVVALAGLILLWRKNSLPVWLALATLFLAVASSTLMARTANLGGQIRHTEIRSGSSSQQEQNNEKHDEKREHEKEGG